MPYYAHAHIMGHLGRDVESKLLPSGKALHEFSVAVTEKRGDKKETSWFSVKVWGDLIQWKLDELKKGALVLVSGRIGEERWEKDGKPGSKIVITADPFSGVQVFGKKDDSDGGMVSQPRSAQRQPIDSGVGDDDLPF